MQASHFKRWMGYVLKQRLWVSLGFVTLFIGIGLDTVLPRVVGYVIDAMLKDEVLTRGTFTLPAVGTVPLSRAFLAVLGFLLVLLTLNALIKYLNALVLTIAGERVHVDIRQAMFDHLHRLPIGFFDTSYTGKIMANITTDTDALWHMLVNGIKDVLGKLILILVVLVLLATIHVRLTLVSLAVLPILIVIGFAARKAARRQVVRQRELVSDMYSTLQEIIGGIRLVRIYNRSGEESRKFSQLMQKLYAVNVKQVKCWAGLATLSEYMTTAFSAAILCLGGTAVTAGQLSIGELVSFYLYVGLMLMPLHMVIHQATERFTTGEVALERIFKLLDTPVGRELEGRKTPCPKLKGQVDFKEVSFSYTEGTPVLSGISFTIKPGETVALVGPSGSGKSTIVNLLCRFYLPTAGLIEVDGHNIDQFEVDSLRSQIGFVSQDSFLFSGSIRDNLLFVKPDASEKELTRAAEQANAHSFITALPNGYDTVVGERGVMLSGGQKQRINLTRALLRNPAILILDEPTAALDADSESIIMEAINTTFRGKTRIIIAHRLATVTRADNILVLSNGSIQQAGTHDELRAQEGLYRELCAKQFLSDSKPESGSPAAASGLHHG